jgi:hypothetical protein
MGCLREADLVGRGGGGISTFLGEGGPLVTGGCTGDRPGGSLRGDGGANEGAEFFIVAVVLLGGIFSAFVRMMLCLLAGATTGFAVESTWACFFPGDMSRRVGEGSRMIGLLPGG